MNIKERKNNKFKVVILSTLAVLLSSCSSVDVRKELLDFTKDFSIETVKEKYKTADFIYEKEIYHFGELKGTKKVTYTFDMTEKGKYTSTLEFFCTGEFITNEFPAYKKVSTYPISGNELPYVRETIINDETPKMDYLNEETFLVDLNNFYGQKTDSGYTKGMYYGDDIKAAFRFQDMMEISEDGQYLTFNSGYIIDNPEDGNISNIYYKVNKDGMLLESVDSGFNKPHENPETSYTATINVTY
ncbi:MAG: hypothetical protein IKB70_01990 [Bacilli bacterium]|nr:hypothetical protein [Bacilli bacterium]